MNIKQGSRPWNKSSEGWVRKLETNGPSKPRRGHGPWAIHITHVKSNSTRNELLIKLVWDKLRRMKIVLWHFVEVGHASISGMIKMGKP
jgi:hypothetical protein